MFFEIEELAIHFDFSLGFLFLSLNTDQWKVNVWTVEEQALIAGIQHRQGSSFSSCLHFFLIVLIGKRLPKWQTRQLPPLWTRALTPICLPAIWLLVLNLWTARHLAATFQPSWEECRAPAQVKWLLENAHCCKKEAEEWFQKYLKYKAQEEARITCLLQKPFPFFNISGYYLAQLEDKIIYLWDVQRRD